MVLEIVFGIRLLMKYASSDARKVWNKGNVVKTANAIVSIGTNASTVVNVRLPATCDNRSSSKRRRAKRSSPSTCSCVNRVNEDGEKSALRSECGGDFGRCCIGVIAIPN